MDELNIGILIAFMAGILSFLSPCVLPLVPSYLAFVTGMSLEDLESGVNRKTTLIHAGLFVGGFSAIFILMGASASFLGQFFRHNELLIARVGGVVIIVLGLHLTGLFRISALMREKRVHVNDKPAGFIGTFGVGMAFGAGWTPCIGPILGGILTFAASREGMWQGVGLLTVYSLGLAIPFLLSALALDWFLQAFKKFRKYLRAVEIGSGVLLVILGILLLTGSFTILTAYLNRFAPAFILDKI